MCRRISAAWALFAVLAMGFAAPSPMPFQTDSVASGGAALVGASTASLTGRRSRAKLAGADGSWSSDGPPRLALGRPPGLTSHHLALVPDSSGQRIALVSPTIPVWVALGTAKTSRGPPAFATL